MSDDLRSLVGGGTVGTASQRVDVLIPPIFSGQFGHNKAAKKSKPEKSSKPAPKKKEEKPKKKRPAAPVESEGSSDDSGSDSGVCLLHCPRLRQECGTRAFISSCVFPTEESSEEPAPKKVKKTEKAKGKAPPKKRSVRRASSQP
jgi:hypothetical protein